MPTIQSTYKHVKWFEDFVEVHCDGSFDNTASKQCFASNTEAYGPVFCQCRSSLVKLMDDKAFPIFVATCLLCVLEAVLMFSTLRLLFSKSAVAKAKENDLRQAEQAAERAKIQQERATRRAERADRVAAQARARYADWEASKKDASALTKEAIDTTMKIQV